MKPLEPMTEEMANKVYDVLVEICGAHIGARSHFVSQQAYEPICEWRFSGHLGFGGKFWRNDGRMYVNCYREDETPERQAMIERANERLMEMGA